MFSSLTMRSRDHRVSKNRKAHLENPTLYPLLVVQLRKNRNPKDLNQDWSRRVAEIGGHAEMSSHKVIQLITC